MAVGMSFQVIATCHQNTELTVPHCNTYHKNTHNTQKIKIKPDLQGHHNQDFLHNFHNVIAGNNIHFCIKKGFILACSCFCYTLDNNWHNNH